MALPSGYTQLKYIRSSGTQYVDTGYIPKSQKLRIVCDFTYVGSYSDRSIFGSEASSQYSICPYGAGPKFYVGTGKSVLSLTSEQGKDYVLDVTADNGTLTVVFDGTTHTASYTGNLLATLSIYLFANNIAGVASQIAPLRVRSCKIYDNGTLVRDFVPAKNGSGTVGLYDTVNGVFYTNAGTGAFAEGPLASGPVEGTGASLIGGASFGINDGKCFVGGTAYAVTEGKTLVGGTGYDVSFAAGTIPVTITGTGDSSRCYVTINGTTYYSAASDIMVSPGDIIRFTVYGYSAALSGRVTIDNTTVVNGTGTKTYDWTIPDYAAVVAIVLSHTSAGGDRTYGRITVTTT